MIFPIEGKEGMLIHGNAPTSLLFIDENGKILLSLSRHGLSQEKTQEEATPSQEGKIFSSWDELKKTFKQIEETK